MRKTHNMKILYIINLRSNMKTYNLYLYFFLIIPIICFAMKETKEPNQSSPKSALNITISNYELKSLEICPCKKSPATSPTSGIRYDTKPPHPIIFYSSVTYVFCIWIKHPYKTSPIVLTQSTKSIRMIIKKPPFHTV